MRLEHLTAIGLVGLLGLAGCAATNERRWGPCAIGGGVLDALVGGDTARGLVEGYGNGGRPGGTDGEVAGSAAGGAVAGAVAGALLAHFLCDLDSSRVETRGYGESTPVASNETAEGPAKNRRADFITE